MLPLLSDPELFCYLPENPPSLAELEERYRRWEPRRSPKGDEIWLNWIARIRETRTPLGHFQAGIKENREAYVAYLVGTEFQRKGYAFEAMSEICRLLENQMNVSLIRAAVDTRNIASLRLLEKLGMKRIDFFANVERFKGSPSDEFLYER
jgi:[ribosomal protein S5]-alanine N-acetyltransferase